MISEESRDSEDWSSDVQNSALHYINTFHFIVYNRKPLF